MKLDARTRAYAALALGGLLLVALAWPVVFARDARHLSAYASGPEDASTFRALLENVGETEALLATPHVLDDIDRPDETILVILGLERRYDATEAQAVIDYLRDGGRVLLVDERGYGSDIAREAGFAFEGLRVLDTANHLGDPKLVVSNVRVDGQSYRVLFNSPTHLVPLSGAENVHYEVLARTSAAQPPHGSYVDKNDNGEIDLGDPTGPLNLVVQATVGRGTLILVSDTGPFMNAQMGVSGYQNVDFASALVQSLAASGPGAGDTRILVDEARHAPHAPLALYANAARTLGRLTQGAAAPFVVGALLAAAFAAWRFTRPTEDWTQHRFSLGDEVSLPSDVRPDAERAQRLARRRISEKYNIPMEQVQAMTAEELFVATGDRALSDAASGALKADPASFFRAPEATS